MPSHLSSIGLPVETEEEFVELAEKVLEHAERLPCRRGAYLHWQDASGAALWLQVDRGYSLIGMNPHFSRASRVRLGTIRTLTRPDDTPLDGAFRAWADPEDESEESGAYPLVFDAPDFLLAADVKPGSGGEAHLTAFAHELQVFESEAAYDDSQTGEMKFASQSFIPSGLFVPEGDATAAPAAEAIFTGHVREAERLTNTLTEATFHWALVETLGGLYDLVADDALVPPGGIPVGGVVSGSFWLSGRLTKYDSRRSLLSRLLGGDR